MATGQVVANDGKLITLNRLWKPIPDYSSPTVFSIGVGSTTPDVTDTDLETKVPISGQEIVDDAETADWTDSAEVTTTLNSTTFKIGSNALNLTKDAGAATAASTTKDTTSLTFGTKRLEFFLYISDTTTLNLLASTDALTVRLSSTSGAGSNYFQWTRDRSELSVGWNYINNMTAANADSENGTFADPAIATWIQLNTTSSGSTWSAGDVIFDDIRLVESGDLTKAFVTGYPILDETNRQSTVRAILLTTDAIGQVLTEFGLKNTDSTAKLFSHAVHTPITKTTSIQIVYVEKDKVV